MAKRRTPTEAAAETAARDAEIRRRMLNVVRLNEGVYQHGYVPFGLLARASDDAGRSCEDEAHAVRLVDDLKSWGLLDEQPRLGVGGNAATNRHRSFKRTDKAHLLWTREIQPIPGVADDRVI